MSIRVICIGAGGHAAVVVDLLQRLSERSEISLAGLVTPDGSGAPVLGVDVIGADGDLGRLIAQHDLTHFIVAVGSTRGGQNIRASLYRLAAEKGLAPLTAVHPDAVVAPSARLGEGTVIMAGAVVQARTVIGNNVIINTRASIDHDCEVGANVHIAPGAVLSGGVRLGDDVHIGTGAVIIENVRVGAGTTVAAGATVVRNCGERQLLVGTPARVI
ncbi:acetyltransferase [Brucella sp. IR073]|uniref:acetyltransferase n=1 Tax=unclassified Brucella TaxID=2632610 RepID=UPI003B97DE6E